MNAAKAALTDPTGVALVLTELGDVGVPPDEADLMVTNESGWNPAAFNPSSKAVGLLQWLPSTLAAMPGEPTTSMVKAMSRTGQAALVAWTFNPGRGYTRTRAGDAYLWIFAPKFFHSPPETIAYPVGSRAWRLNPGMQEPHGGPITVRRILAIGSGAETPGGPGPGSGKFGIPSGGSSSTSTGIVVLLLLLFAASRR